MVHIETFHRQVDGNNITQRYLSEQCVVMGDKKRIYRNIDYSGSFRPKYANEMCNLLGEVQNDLCCYCMRHLPKDSKQITLEHIVPQSCSDEEFDRYISLGYNELTEKNLILTHAFSGKPIATELPPMPHTVAYHNFLISCDGSFVTDNKSHLCCNNARGDQFLIPVFFNENIADEIEYTPQGVAKAKNTAIHRAKIISTISVARLNCNTLKEIRSIWYKFRALPLQMLEEAVYDYRKKTSLLLKYCENNNSLKNKYVRSYKWQLLLSYSWFHSYYKSHYE